jgi:hypothetical protein
VCLAKTRSTFEISKMQRGCVTCYMGPAGAVMGQTRFSVGTIVWPFRKLGWPEEILRSVRLKVRGWIVFAITSQGLLILHSRLSGAICSNNYLIPKNPLDTKMPEC